MKRVETGMGVVETDWLKSSGPLTVDTILDGWLDVRDALRRPMELPDPNVSGKADASPALAHTTSADPNVSAQPADPNVSASQE
jgi:hypothetical protein